MRTGGEILVELLIQYGVTHIFGVPGNQLTPVYKALAKHREAIAHILARHEGGAGLMAEGYAKASGKPGVCLVSPGPGAANAYTAVLEAFTSCTPLLLITVQNNDHEQGYSARRLFHGLDHAEAFASVTKQTIVVSELEALPSAVFEAFHRIRNQTPGPVLIEIKEEILGQSTVGLESPEEDVLSLQSAGSERDEEALERAVALIKAAKRPAILAGKGVGDEEAGDLVTQLAEKIQAPIITTILSKGVVSEFHPHAAGLINSNYGKGIIEQADLLISIAPLYNQVDMRHWQISLPEKSIQIEKDPMELGQVYSSTTAILGGIADILGELLLRLDKSEFTPDPWDVQQLLENKPVYDGQHNDFSAAIIDALNGSAGPELILVNDVHVEGYPLHYDYRVHERYGYIHSPISVGIGYALPAAIGAKFAHPDKKVIVFCGDGGFLLSSPEFSTLMRYRLNIVVVIVNDHAYGTIRRRQERDCWDFTCADLANPDFRRFAGAYRCAAVTVEEVERFAEVLSEAVQREDGPFLIELVKKGGSASA
ncbi:thiamine pyrophosphate-binding protein [Paenibacillus sp. M1]|uniref:Thiamine pyrophosphate-binding protein n=1 Tax=Paenibacillus haidiansis TaxID=1574488 RepID=A0ABU7VVN0_9BACL